MRPMFIWRDDSGSVVADIVQIAKMTPGGPKAFFVARVHGDQVEKPRFGCAQRVIADWLRKNRIQATVTPG